MWTDNTLQPIEDLDPYTDSNGIQYPGNYPKSEIPGLYQVTLTSRPSETIGVTVNGFHINEDYVQIWDTTSLSDDEITAINTANTNANYIAESLVELAKSDITYIRASEANIAFPSEWVSYRATLRAIVDGSQTGPLPTRPNYPA